MTYVDELTVSEARARLPELLDRIERGEEITITRHGRPAAVMLRPDAVRVTARGEHDRPAQGRSEGCSKRLEHRPLGPPTLDAEYAEELDRGRSARTAAWTATNSDGRVRRGRPHLRSDAPGHPLGRRVHRLFSEATERHVGIGSVVLLPEVLAKPLRDGATDSRHSDRQAAEPGSTCGRPMRPPPRSPPPSRRPTACVLPMRSIWRRRSPPGRTASSRTTARTSAPRSPRSRWSTGRAARTLTGRALTLGLVIRNVVVGRVRPRDTGRGRRARAAGAA